MCQLIDFEANKNDLYSYNTTEKEETAALGTAFYILLVLERYR